MLLFVPFNFEEVLHICVGKTNIFKPFLGSYNPYLVIVVIGTD